jgi:outer membrane protein insertion porin family
VRFKGFPLILVFLLVPAGAKAAARPASATALVAEVPLVAEAAPSATSRAPVARPARDSVPATPDLSRYEGRLVESIELAVEDASLDEAVLAELRTRLRVAAGQKFSAVLVRESLRELFDTGRVADARVEAFDAATLDADGRPAVRLRFVIRPRVVVGDIDVEIGVTEGVGIAEDELRARVNILEPGMRLTESALRRGADAIIVYMRDRGYYRAAVTYEQQLDAARTRATIIYRVEPGPPTLLESFDLQVRGFDSSKLLAELPMRPGDRFTLQGLGENLARVRQGLIAEGYLSPRLAEPGLRFDSATNRMSVSLEGDTGPRVEVEIAGYELSEKRRRELLPVLREGTIEPSAVEEGARRLEIRLQEEGYFFADVTTDCAVTPPLPAEQAAPPLFPDEEGPGSCDLLNPDDLTGRSVRVLYNVERGRRFELRRIAIEGTDALSIEEVEGDLRTRTRNLLGFIPFFGLGRGYTSEEALQRDRRTVEARMRELGYRQAAVTIRRGVSLEGDNLIITFVVSEGQLTRVADIEVRGNQIFTADRLRGARCPADPLPDEACLTAGAAFSRAQARADGERLRAFYVRNGYAESEVQLDVVELLSEPDADQRVRLVYTVNEADKVFINRILVNGLVQTKKEAVLEAIPLREREVLRGDELLESERVLLNSTDAFRQVLIRTEPAGETAGGFKRRDVIIDVEERKSITTDYIIGYSTDTGALGGFDVRHVNLFGQLRQGGFRSRFSRLQQLVRLDYFDPRFQRYGAKSFAPLSLSAQYQRDTSVTRFFRTTIDRGSQGVVQRFDEEGNIVDEFGQPVGAPSINRFTFTAETQRDLELELSPTGAVRRRSTIFLRYNYEDVRLFNIGSLLIAPVLRPDQAVRLSRFGVSFARDTRDRQFDPTRGEFLTVDYALALKALGGNLSFNKLLTTYRRYKKINRVRETVLAASVQLGLGNMIRPSDRNDNGVIDDADLRLPISERFFGGGSASLRGFGFEEAGPRLVFPQCDFNRPPTGTLPTCGVFRNQEGEVVELNPFTVPIGGNALAVVNLEARVGATRGLQVVPFYDGGNVFERVSDLFGKGDRAGRDPNVVARWTHTVGLGLRLKTPIGSLGVDYGYLLNPPRFLIPQQAGPPAVFTPARGRIHFRFGQTF